MARMPGRLGAGTPPDDVRDAIEAVASSRSVERNGVLFRRGEPAPGIYVIRQGRVILTLSERIHRTMEQGSILGLTAVFSGKPYSLTATADGDCEVAFVASEKVVEFVRFNPRVALYFLEVLAAEVAALRELAPVRKSRTCNRGRREIRLPRRIRLNKNTGES